MELWDSGTCGTTRNWLNPEIVAGLDDHLMRPYGPHHLARECKMSIQFKVSLESKNYMFYILI